MKTLMKIIAITCFLIISGTPGLAQTQMPLPAHSATYTGTARGLWFVAPVNFTITGLKVPPEAGTGTQYIHLLECHGQLPCAYTAPLTAFTTLAYISGAPNNTIVPVNIPVLQGDTIVIMGVVQGEINSYSASGIHTSTIGTYTVPVGRAGTQAGITGGPAVNFWGYDPLTSYQLGRVFIYYQLAAPTDAGLQTFVFPSDTVCEGAGNVSVVLKNHGPSSLQSVDIHWDVNNVAQPTHSWSGNIPVNDSASVTIGSYPFQNAVNYSLKAYTSLPNNSADTVHTNDTIIKTGIYVKTGPAAIPASASYTVCAGDSIAITGTLSGLPPWSITMYNGSVNQVLSGLINPAFSFVVSPVTNSTYSIVQVSDAGGCTNYDTTDIAVMVYQKPPAVITPIGSTAACEGDSVTLMASIGLNFSYHWYRDGINLTGDTTYVLNSKVSGSYEVKVTNPGGCSQLSSPVSVFIHPTPMVNIGNDTSVAPGSLISLSAGAGFASYLWSNGATSPSTTIDSSGTGIGTKTIWVLVTDNNGCTGTDTIKINFNPNPGIEKNLSENGLSIIPNPADGKFKLILNPVPPGEVLIEIFQADGKLVFSSKYQLLFRGEEVPVDVNQTENGICLLKVTHEDGVWIRKLIIRN
jgi:hypothetical protein